MGIVRMQIGRRPKATFTYPDYSETV
jgi:hypothetical protein